MTDVVFIFLTCSVTEALQPLIYLFYCILFIYSFFLSFCCSVSRVGRRNKIGHPVHRHKRFKQGPLSVRCLVEYIDLQLGETVQALYGGNLISFPFFF